MESTLLILDTKAEMKLIYPRLDIVETEDIDTLELIHLILRQTDVQ